MTNDSTLLDGPTYKKIAAEFLECRLGIDSSKENTFEFLQCLTHFQKTVNCNWG